MKLKDLYEQYELKKNDNNKQGTGYTLYNTDKYDIVVLEDGHNIEIKDDGIENKVWNYDGQKINNSEKLIKFIEDNYDIVYNIKRNSKSIDMICNIKNYGGYSDWKIIDKDFTTNDGDKIYSNLDGGGDFFVHGLSHIQQTNNNFDVITETIFTKYDNASQSFVFSDYVTLSTYPFIWIDGYYRIK